MYHNQKFNIFISYRGNSEGGLLGSKIYTDLLHYTNNINEKEFTPFFAPACIPKGEDFKQTIASVMEDVRCVVLVLNNGFFDDCSKDDDMVFFELITALKNPAIKFIPIVLDSFSFNKETNLISLFDSSDIDRLKHVNAINYHGIYDFKTEVDLIPVLHNALKNSQKAVNAKTQLEFNVGEWTVAPTKHVTFGRYPQTVVADIQLIDKIATGMFSGDTILNPRTNMLSHDGNDYATITENPFNKTTFSNGKVVSSGARNYYRVEPLKWIELFRFEEYTVLITERLIDAVQFNLNQFPHRTSNNETFSANNWEYSYIRRWLNNEFYYDAFSEAERSKIQTALIDNSHESSYFKSSNVKNTVDNVFLISHREIMLTEHGCAITTDYAKARGAYSSTSSSHYGHGDWWTRSVGNVASSIENIDRRGCINVKPFCNFVDDTAAAVRPCIIIRS